MPAQGITPQNLQDAYLQSNTVPGGYNSTQWANIVNSSGLPGMDPTSPEYQSIAGNLLGYQLSDQDFAARFPQMVQARNTYQGLINQLAGPQAQASMTAGNNWMANANTLMPTASTLMGEGVNWNNRGLEVYNQGRNFLWPAETLATQAPTIGTADVTLGQNLISGNTPIDPLVQQELMRSGLSSAAGALGGAEGLGGTAGQAAIGRQLGVGAQNWINQQRQMGMQLQQTGLGLTSGTANAAATLSNAATGLYGTGANIAGMGANMAGTGANIAGTGANIAATGQGIINSAAQNANQGMAIASQIFQPRQFGLSGSDLANISLANTTGQNNMNQFLYSTKVQGAQYNNQIAGANAAAGAQSTGNLIQGGVGIASSAAVIGLAITCHVARACFGPLDNRLYRFRFWLMNLAPDHLRKDYLKHALRTSWELISDHPRRTKWRTMLSRCAALAPYAPAY